MGNSSSAASLSQEQRDIKYLGDRFPYGDDELIRLYRMYQAIRESDKRVSFLSDLAVHCVVLPPRVDDEEKLHEMREQQLMLMTVVEEKILPPGFGCRFERVSFVNLQHAAETIAEEEDEYSRLAKLEKFMDGAAASARRGGRAALGTLFQCCVEDVDDPDDSSHLVHRDGNEFMAKGNQVLDLAYRLSLAAAFLSAHENMQNFIPNPDSSHNEVMESLARSLLEYVKRKKVRASKFGDLTEAEEDDALAAGLVSKMDFLEWSEATAPLLSSTLPTFMHCVFFPDRPYPPSRTPFLFPTIQSESAFFYDPASPMLFAFATMSSSLGGAWHRLYTSTSDGLSFNRLQNSLLGYSGPTLIIIQATSGGIFGAFTASSWKESKDFYGNSDCFLYQLLPSTAVYRPRGNGTNYMYCNSEARSRGYDQLAHGIGFGGTTNQPRLFISEVFERNTASSGDMTFEPGPLLPCTEKGSLQTTFEIENLEVFGVGGDEVVAEALESRVKARAVKDANIAKARKVDKAAFLDDLRNGVIETKAFKHRSEIAGRAECDLEERIAKQKGLYDLP